MPNTGFKQVTRATRTWIDDTGTQCACGRHLNPLPPEEIAAMGAQIGAAREALMSNEATIG